MAYIYSLADTWNASGTTFTGIGLNVTDTASAAGSMLMDLQVGGSSRFSVTKGGTLAAQAGSAAAPGYGIGTTGLGIYSRASVRINFATSGSDTGIEIGGNLLALAAPASVAWVSGTLPSSGIDLFLLRDAANTLGQRNNVNAQAFNLYNTYTDASNYERGRWNWVGNELRFGTEAAGTGSSRSLGLYVGNTRYQIIGSSFTQFDQPIYMNTTGIATGVSGFKIGTATTQGLGFWNATPSAQPTAVADATDAASVITQLNALLSRMRTIGLIAT